MSTIKKIILHVGPYKTGSTSIQKYAASNMKVLLAEGILYPSFHSDHGPLFRNAFSTKPEKFHNNIIRNMNLLSIKQEVKSSLENMMKEINIYNPEIIFISGEHISDLNEKEIYNMKAYLKNICDDIQVVYYVRDPEGLIVSDFQEAVKAGRAKLHDWKFDYIIPRYEETIDFFKKTFGASNVNIEHFDVEIGKEGGMVASFYKKYLNINIDQSLNSSSNVSINNLSFILLEMQNRSNPSVINNAVNHNRSAALSKFLMNQKSDRKIKFQFDLKDCLVNKINRSIDKINKYHQLNVKKLKFFPSKKEDNLPTSEELESFICSLNDNFKQREIEVSIIVDLLRDGAVELEEKNLDLSFKMIEKALELRPTGPFLNKKYNEMLTNIKKKDN